MLKVPNKETEAGVVLGIINHPGRPPVSYPECLVKILFHLAELLICKCQCPGKLAKCLTVGGVVFKLNLIYLV